MTVERVYIDTSVLGGCFDAEFARWSNGLMKDFRLGNFKPVFSKIVALEVVDVPDEVKDIYAELLVLEHEFLDITREASTQRRKFEVG